MEEIKKTSNVMMKKIAAAVAAMVLGCAAIYAADIKILQAKTSPAVESAEKAAGLKDGLRTLAGVKKVTVDKDKHVVKVRFDADKVSKDAVVSAISKLGYKVADVTVKDAAPKTDGVSGASRQSAAKK